MNFSVGTSGFSYPKWKGKFYPAKMPAAEMLGFYASKFRSVEINNTFRKPPEVSVLKEWADQVPAAFQFAFKAPQRITHIKRLKDVGDEVTSLVDTLKTLKKRLGPLLFGLPPNFKKDVPRLRGLFQHLKPTTRVAFEFRHPSWFDDEVYALLRKHQAALCIADTEDLETPFIATTDWGYLRLRKTDYTATALKKWAKQMKEQAWSDCTVFFMHEDTGTGPKFAAQLLDVLGA
jgi:uncharacterized protein YecE (DUF72 family)